MVISGTHGTGKTALVTALAAALQINHQAIVIDEAARVLASRLKKDDYYLADFTLEKQLTFCLFQLLFEDTVLESAVATVEYVVFDRSIIDPWAYLWVLFPKYTESETAKLVWNLVKARAKRKYDRHFIADLEIPFAGGEGRNPSSDFRRKVHEQIIALYGAAEIPFIRVRGTVEERVAQILSSIPKSPSSKSFN
jgi:predicted ATPase